MLPATRGLVHITVRGQGGRAQRPGLRIHRSTQPLSSTIRNAIALTTPARTLTDLRRSVDPQTLRRATRQAAYLGLELDAIETDRTRSELERAFLRLCRRHRLPAPEVNVSIGPYTVDFLWREQHLVVETDGYSAHRGRQAFEDDRERELWLHARGYRVLRFSGRQVRGRAGEVAAAVRALTE